MRAPKARAEILVSPHLLDRCYAPVWFCDQLACSMIEFLSVRTHSKTLSYNVTSLNLFLLLLFNQITWQKQNGLGLTNWATVKNKLPVKWSMTLLSTTFVDMSTSHRISHVTCMTWSIRSTETGTCCSWSGVNRGNTCQDWKKRWWQQVTIKKDLSNFYHRSLNWHMMCFECLKPVF